MQTTIWKPVTGYEGFYAVSADGQVKRLGGSPKCKRDRILKQARHPQGYRQVALSKDGKPATRLVHQLVAEAFIAPCPPNMEVNHINGDKTDNRVGNLEYVTRSGNTSHAYNTGLRRRLCGRKNPNARITDEQEGMIVTSYVHALSDLGGVTGIARALGLPYSTVYGVIQRYKAQARVSR